MPEPAAIAAGGLVGAGACLAVAPYLARLTRSAPDEDDAAWWRVRRGHPATRARVVVTAVVGVVVGGLAGAASGWSALLPAFVALALCAAPLAVIDVERHRLPDRLVRPAAGAAVVWLAVAALVRGDWWAYLRAVEAAAAVFAALFVLALISPASFGYGDVKLGAVLGGYLGWFGWGYVYWGIFAGFVVGSVVSLALLATRRASLKSAIAFGPMLLAGALLALVLGQS